MGVLYERNGVGVVKVDVRKIYGDEGRYGWYDYQPMIDAFGKIAIQVDDDAFQGDSRVLYDENGKIGCLIFGWGSCSGCDSLQACRGWDDVQELCDELQNDIKWFENKKEALVWFKTHDWEGNYYGHSCETKEFIQKCIEHLSKEGEQK